MNLLAPFVPETVHDAVEIMFDGQTDRLTYGDLVGAFTRAGVGFFSYDKRGRGTVPRSMLSGDYGHFNLLTADAVGVNALRSSVGVGVGPSQIGLVGTSQAGWIVPRAAVDSQQVAFVALASAAILPYDQVKASAELPGGSGSDTPFPSWEEITKRLQDAGASVLIPSPTWSS